MLSIDWIFSIIPIDVFIIFTHILVIVSLVCFLILKFVNNLPLVGNQIKLLLPIFFIVFLIGIYLEGNFSCREEHQKKIEEIKRELKLAEERSKIKNEVIKIQYVDKVKLIKERGKENVKYIEKIVTKYDNLCTLSNAAIGVHNSASQNEIPGSTSGIDEGTSDVKASELLRTVAENYQTCHEIREQVISWQNWYKEQKKIYEK